MAEPRILLQIRRLLPDGVVVNRDTIGEAPGERGAYVLIVHLADPVRFSRKNIGDAVLAGWHVYAGSARGAGGILSRLQRHFHSDKRVHWHVDELTNIAAEIWALAVAGGSECGIVDRLLGSGLFEPALRGFGSSDCTMCEAHLLRPAQMSARRNIHRVTS